MDIELDDNEVTNAMYAGSSLMSNLNSLTANQYVCIKSSFKSNTSKGNMYNFKFESNKAKRKISILYSPCSSDSDLYSFYVSIDSDDDRISLETLINDHKLYDGVDYFDLDNYEGSTKQKIQQFVKFLDKVFTENFPDIISGKKWEHIGFDWQGYK